MIFRANQLTSFYMRAAMTFNRLMMIKGRVLMTLIKSHRNVFPTIRVGH